ncbi:DeoR/GlpR family DNA-binding transcription regulator [Gilliamella sp. Pas-s95]|uniref:DeoR/GlpR family DNA-binding transcription regulator n=1 Tax=Gilliamella sp. Pas-s95 TaxID=2687317 RepID=UPI00132C3E16|nr:DeoR/GlpR family DNA-binding transcription regulator [Gilliamella sp. Pas-s95]MWN05441.1 DeoR family transcriptional regulator [Gilliamella sp. Pas-s95]
MNQELPRYKRILEYLDEYDVATINLLSNLFSVSHMSIRRDLKILQEKGLVRVSYGGEIKRSFLNGTPLYNVKQSRFSESKKKVGKIAAGLLQPGMVIFIDAGTTMREFALNINVPITAITPDLHIAIELTHRPEINTIICPGEVQNSIVATYNTQTMKYLSEQVIDLAFIGADGFNFEDGALTTTQIKADCKWMAVSRSIQSALLVDSSKLGLRCRFKICDLNRFNYLITEKKFPESFEKKLVNQDIKFIY